MTTTDNHLCARIDGADVCAAECWRASALGDRECPPPTLRRVRCSKHRAFDADYCPTCTPSILIGGSR